MTHIYSFVFVIAALLIAGCDQKEGLVELNALQPKANSFTSSIGEPNIYDSQQYAQANAPSTSYNIERLSYGMGHSIGTELYKKLHTSALHISMSSFIEGFRQAASGGDSLYQADRLAEDFSHFQQVMEQDKKTVHQKNTLVGKSFLSQNLASKSVTALPSGLQYKILTAGNGDIADLKSQVTMHYEGRLINGDIFDSSYDGSPVSFFPNDVMPAWKEALLSMPVGSTWELYVPYELTNPDMTRQGILPGQLSIFRVELLDVKKDA